jgi:hypothetical protein
MCTAPVTRHSSPTPAGPSSTGPTGTNPPPGQRRDHPGGPTSPARRYFGVVARAHSYRNIAYLLLGLPLGTLWFTFLVSGLSVGISMVVVALLGIPLLLGLWYVIRACANVERGAADRLLGGLHPLAPLVAPGHGGPWARLRSMSGERDRWREFGYLLLRFPVGVATFTIAVTALTTPLMVAYAPFEARYGGDHPFGDWAHSAAAEEIASSTPWSWLLVPLGLALLFGSFHLLNALADACGRWTTAWLGSGANRGASAACAPGRRPSWGGRRGSAGGDGAQRGPHPGHGADGQVDDVVLIEGSSGGHQLIGPFATEAGPHDLEGRGHLVLRRP